MIHILSPHGDDELISCFPILQNSHEKKIAVFGHSRDPRRLTEYFPSIVATKYFDCCETPYHIGRAVYKKNYKEWANTPVGVGRHLCYPDTPWEFQLTVTQNSNGELWKEAWKDTAPKVLDYLKFYCLPGDLIMSPIGIIHPYHILLACAVEDYRRSFPHFKFGYYSEAPYNSAKWVRKIIESHPYAKDLVRVQRYPVIDTDDIDLKERILRDVYPTEVKLLRFHRESILHSAHEFFVPSGYEDKVTQWVSTVFGLINPASTDLRTS